MNKIQEELRKWREEQWKGTKRRGEEMKRRG